MKLIIAEKPSVARELVAAIPENFQQSGSAWFSDTYIVSSAIGHLLTLADPEAYNPEWKKWRKDSLPIIPDQFILKPAQGKSKHITQLKKLFTDKRVKTIINACDAGREGELIFAYLYQYLKSKKPVQRLWLRSLTKQAISQAFSELKPGSEFADLQAAARARSQADWIVGINATRAATIHFRPAIGSVVSLGRVQTPTLALLVKRELEITNFVPEKFWNVEAVFQAAGGEYLAGYNDYQRLSEKEAKQVLATCQSENQGVVNEIKEKRFIERPPLLFDLTSLQRKASSDYNFSAKRTLAAAQKLYEKKLITYPRTNSRYLSSDLRPEVTKLLSELKQRPEYKVTGVAHPRVYDDSKVSDHHAIILTNKQATLSGDELKIYSLIERRLAACFAPEAQGVKQRVTTLIRDHAFISKGKQYSVLGWREIEPGQEQLLPQLKENEVVKITAVKSQEKETKPPPHYSDGTLLAAMESAGKDLDPALREAMKENGLGTPATRAAIIERLLNVDYIQRSGKTLMATEKGIQVITALGSHPLVSPQLTGGWEKKLLDIEQSKYSVDKFNQEIISFANQSTADIFNLTIPELKKATLGPCPLCGKPVVENRKGFSCWSKDNQDCGFVIWKKLAGKTLPKQVIQELYQNGKTAQPVSGFKSKKGKAFSARLKLVYNKDNKQMRTVFNEDWAN